MVLDHIFHAIQSMRENIKGVRDMVINRLQKAILDNALRVYSDKHSNINILPTNGTFADDEPLVFGVNWGAWGTQDTETTKVFAKHLKQAAELADELTKLRLVVDYITEPNKVELDTMNYLIRKYAMLLDIADTELLLDVLQRYDVIANSYEQKESV